MNTSDGGYVMVGYTDAYGHGKNDIWVIKTDFTGEKEWSGVYGGKSDDYGWGITETKDNGFVIAGETFSYGNGQSDGHGGEEGRQFDPVQDPCGGDPRVRLAAIESEPSHIVKVENGEENGHH